VAAPCDCRACAASAYVRLLHSAQRDQDAGHRRQAMDYLATIGPMAGSIGADGSCPGDSAAAPMLATLYPDDKPQPGPPVQDVIAEIEAAAVKRVEQFMNDLRQNAAVGGQIIAGHPAHAADAVHATADSAPAGD
jgi:hypothetical protein